MTLPDVYCRVNRARGMEVRDVHACMRVDVHACTRVTCRSASMFSTSKKYCTNVLAFLISTIICRLPVCRVFFNGACRGKVEITIS